MGVPWWAKIAAKLVLARLPLSWDLRRRLGVFRAGAMDDLAYARRQMENAIAVARTSGGPPEGFAALEFGPGDSVASAVVAKAYGASSCTLIDVSPSATRDVGFYRRVADSLRADGLPAPDLSAATTLEDVLAACDARYLTDGTASLRAVADGSVHVLFSNAVLEHVRAAEFDRVLAEFRRVTAPGGRHLHAIDLRDHLDGGLNNLRFPSKVWEAAWMARSGFYTNRIPYSDMLRRFEAAGFALDVRNLDRRAAPPLRRAQLAAEFRDRAEDDLLVRTFVLRLALQAA